MADDDKTAAGEIEELALHASLYVKCAIKHLTLEPSSPTVVEITRLDSLANRLLRLQSSLPHEDTVDRPKLITHFLFPNLSDEERALICDLHNLSFEIAHEERVALQPDRSDAQRLDAQERAREARVEHERKKRAMTFEAKLTAVQLDILESSFCNPDAKDDLDWN